MNKDNKKINLGIFTHNFPKSSYDRKNAGIFVFDLANSLAKNICLKVFFPSKNNISKVGKVSCFSFKYSAEKKLGSLKIYNPFDIYALLMFFVKGLSSVDKFASEYPSINFSLAMWAFPSGVFTYFLKKTKNIHYGLWVLGSDIYIYSKMPILSSLIKKIIKEADFVIADGIDLSKEVTRISGKKCIFIPSASDFDLNNIRRDANTNNKTILTFLGRMESVKGPDILINALIKLGRDLSNFQVNLLGDGKMLKGLKDLVEKEGLQNRIKFYGNVSDEKLIKKILINSDWLIIPSRSESIPLVFSEAMKSNLPLIVSDLPDLEYLVKKYNVGLCFKNEDSSGLVKLLKNRKNLEEKRKIFISHTEEVAKIFNIDYSSEQLIDLIRRYNK